MADVHIIYPILGTKLFLFIVIVKTSFAVAKN